MPADRDVGAFNDRAPGYESGRRGQLHHEIADRTVAAALACVPAPRRVLDVGCGTGYALRQLAGRLPGALELTGIDAAPQMVEVAGRLAGDERLAFSLGTAERLPFPDAAFDLVISTTSFDHWADQRAGIAECGRVLAPGGYLVLTDLFSAWLVPTLTGGRRAKARTRGRVTPLITAAGLREPRWHRGYAVIISTVTAVRPP
ncbi:MAG TPA: class I SAM-dependent methyltransferase [Streptosporangiaceae bacterium]|nr:class I SAM-dependent methyltransferase [Streptosporangiaceae bacterium]